MAAEGVTVTMDEVARHNKKGDCWLVLETPKGVKKVYDVSDFLDDHPGGAGAILQHAGKDGTEDFMMIHDVDVLKRHASQAKLIGTIGAVNRGLPTAKPPPSAAAAKPAAGSEYAAGWSKDKGDKVGAGAPSVGDDVDVIVVGSGSAGASAALGAVLRGAQRVLVLEKSANMPGGTTRLAGGGWVWFPNNQYLTKIGVRQPESAIVDLLQELAYPKADGVKPDPGDLACMRAFAAEGPGVINTMLDRKFLKFGQVRVKTEEDKNRARDLLKEKAAKFGAETAGLTPATIEKLCELMPSYCGDHPLDMVPVGNVLSGGSTAKQLLKACETFPGKIEVRMGCEVSDIIRGPGGRVEGVQYRVMKGDSKKMTRSATGEKMFAISPTGETRTVRARGGVVFAAGGFSHNPPLMQEAGIPISGTCAAPTNTGDFVTIARRHNIPVPNMSLAWVKQVVMPFNERRTGVFFLNADSFFVVDRLGKRYANEKNFYQQRGMQMRENMQDRRFVFFIFDGRSRKLFEGPLKGLGGPIPMRQLEKDCLIQKQQGVPSLCTAIRKKLGEVAPDYQLDGGFEATLTAQLDRFNAGAKKGIDADGLGRGVSVAEHCWHVPRAADNKFPNKTMMPLNASDLCCVILGLSTLDTKAGPRTDAAARVLGADGQPVPGLYAAGNSAHAWSRNSYPASGTTIAAAITFGFIAGREAAASVPTGAKL